MSGHFPEKPKPPHELLYWAKVPPLVPDANGDLTLSVAGMLYADLMDEALGPNQLPKWLILVTRNGPTVANKGAAARLRSILVNTLRQYARGYRHVPMAAAYEPCREEDPLPCWTRSETDGLPIR